MLSLWSTIKDSTLRSFPLTFIDLPKSSTYGIYSKQSLITPETLMSPTLTTASCQDINYYAAANVIYPADSKDME